MTQKDLQFLAEIYNRMLEIHTKGQDTFVMADCMQSLHQFIMAKGKELQELREE